MSLLTQSFTKMESSITDFKTGVKIPRHVQKPLEEQIAEQRYADGITEPNTALEVASKSWRDKKRLYPPFRQRGKDVFVQNDDQTENEIVEKLFPERKYRFSVCVRRKQLPITCANTSIPLVCIENDPEFGESDFLYLSSGCGGDNEIPSTCALAAVAVSSPCIEPICALQDNEPRNITRGADRADDVCQDAISAQDDKSDDLSVPCNKPDSHHYMTVSCESIDYVICENREESTFTSFEDESSFEDQEYFDIHDEEYEDSGSTSKHKAKSELVSKSELFQDPLVSHRLTIPYKKIPPARYYVGETFNDSSKMKFLTKRPQSPVRDILDGRFDVEAGIAELTRRAEIYNAKYALRKSKDWLAGMIPSDSMSSPTTCTSAQLLTTFLKVLLEDVRLSLTVGQSENDLSLTLATIWAITEFAMTEAGLEVKHFVTIASLGVLPKLKRPLSHNLTLLKANSFQRTSDIGYPPRGSDSHSLHRAPPWVHLCGVHAEGLPKSYVTLRTYIGGVTHDKDLRRPRTCPTHLSDISCAHFKEMLFSKPGLVENSSEELESENRVDRP